MAMTVLWQDMTRDEIAAARDRGAVVAVPVGAIEQHASHLPVDTDARNMTAVTRRAAGLARSVPVLVTPTLSFGFSPHHLSHAGTISLRLTTYLAVLGDIAASLADTGFTRIVVVNGHGGNSAPLRSKIAELVTDGLPVTGVDYWAPAEAEWTAMLSGVTRHFGHACEFETALMLAIGADDPDFVERVTARSRELPARKLQPWVVPGETRDPITQAKAAWPPIFQGDDVGYFGDPAAATLEAGRKMLDVLARRLATFFEDFAAMPIRFGRSILGQPPRVSPPIAGAASKPGGSGSTSGGRG
jgi:creatinine amidohydrolase